jgi:hypothetical protein
VPISRLLENTVVNWTLSDRRLRASVGVGVVYGSPVARTKEILTSSVRAHPYVLPEPVIVLLEDFAADALLFRVNFWTEVESEMEERTIESDIRRTIEQRCAEAGITIAFPLRGRPRGRRRLPTSVGDSCVDQLRSYRLVPGRLGCRWERTGTAECVLRLSVQSPRIASTGVNDSAPPFDSSASI